MPRADFYLIGKPRFRDEPLLLVCELARKAHDAGLWTLVLVRDALGLAELPADAVQLVRSRRRDSVFSAIETYGFLWEKGVGDAAQAIVELVFEQFGRLCQQIDPHQREQPRRVHPAQVRLQLRALDA